ncbi:riboflavin synthase, alpha subunit [Beutenbergia cavernae DSM 12333]|uniref:Riboflavin synthase n=1 Tax=Beutenbergia cavernae (strain ATCC BAA-8 / DSM 12333 / CCUG 43141 / JCM 11478 / NBRC 16432 / NCIMB 13614 / HKI 0122) TaxID=471853 RepID=C5C4P3_BEUC1|nr:riboflavin synthase [Beutenbergia cavernae]ACQ80021.1 riboflavin synthase, alpha subunit [Beutenbergia cavernae DSM 12333]
MFTGIVETIGVVVDLRADDDAARLTVRGLAPERIGDSLAVDGVCLTVTRRDGDEVELDVMPETLRRSTLGALRAGDRVNLERAVRADGRLDGHLVQGHVDGVGSLVRRAPGARWDDLELDAPAPLLRYVAEKGSIAVSGVSLTVTHVGGTTFGVSLIPSTLAGTTLGGLAPGDRVNLEVDVVAKYVERLLDAGVGPAAASRSAGDGAASAVGEP